MIIKLNNPCNFTIQVQDKTQDAHKIHTQVYNNCFSHYNYLAYCGQIRAGACIAGHVACMHCQQLTAESSTEDANGVHCSLSRR